MEETLLKAMWPVFILIVAIVIIRVFFERLLPNLLHRLKIKTKFKKGETWRSGRELLQWLREMKPAEFEEYIAKLFNKLGYKAKAVGKSHDGGIDVIAEKDGIKYYIQCKKFITSTVSVGAMRDFYGAVADRFAKGKAYFVTTNKFTLEAEKYAEDKPIELIDGHRLVEYIHLAEKQKAKTQETKTDEIKKCPQCDGALVQREGKFGKFFGCSNYPKCKFTKKKKK